MTKVRLGDRVRIKERETTEADVTSMSYFPHYAGLVGEVARVYDSGEAAVTIDSSSLDASIIGMHQKVEERVKAKFLAGLSEEGRKRLSPEERELRLNYVVLVKTSDLEPVKVERGARTSSRVEAKTAAGTEPAGTPQATTQEPSEGAPPAKRPSAKDLAKAEQEYLSQRRKAR